MGYNGGSNSDELWKELKAVAIEIANNPVNIVEEARRLGSPESCERGCCELDTYANNYINSFDTMGHPVSFVETGDVKELIQMASTDDDIKFHVRRAYIRLVIEAMHHRGIEVNLTVV